MEDKIMFTAGQRRIYHEGEETVRFKRVPFDKAEVITTEAPLEIHPKFADKGFLVIRDVTEFIPGVDAKMVDWWWGNMEKGYHIWAPGEHYGFDWIVPPVEVGYEGSVEASYEFDPLHPLIIERQPITTYPFTECYEHCWYSKAVLGDVATFLVHMYKDVEGGIYWRTVTVTDEKGAKFLEAHKDDIPLASHMEYESGRLKDFLPQLYELWKDHPDPWENIHYDLTVEKLEDGTWKHKYDNKPAAK